MSSFKAIAVLILLISGLVCTGCRNARQARAVVIPESRHLTYRSPESLPLTPLPSYADPRTVSFLDNTQEDLKLSLDEAIRIALSNSKVIRVLAGNRAASSGQTIYDPGIANTAIDQTRGRFDPNLSINNTFSQNEQANGIFIPVDPGARIVGTDTDSYVLDGSLTDLNALGGTTGLRVGVSQSDIDPGLFPLNPQTNSFTELSYVQPLLKGGGVEANLAPVLIASIETERSFFQLKGSVQDLVRGVIEGYWSLVFARTDRWAREQQVEQATKAYDRELARKRRQLADLGDVSQARVALANFRANLIAAKANVLQREAALLNIMGLSPVDVGEVIPLTPPHSQRLSFEWAELISLAERYRPDIVQLKLIIEADYQRVILAENSAKPRLDAIASYRWDGLQGRTPSGSTISTDGGEYTDWTLGVNFSVPLGLRQGRAELRQQELVVARDRANLDQGLHSATHQIALTIRNQDQFYEQYQAFLEARAAAQENLLVQQAEFVNGRTIFLNVLQAITDWGNSVSAEAQSLSQYNTELANLELETGTILEAHGVRFNQERKCFIAPCGIFSEACYPAAIPPTENSPRYPAGDEPAEQSFDLQNPIEDGLGNRRIDLPSKTNDDRNPLPLFEPPVFEKDRPNESIESDPKPAETAPFPSTDPLFVP
ncbi:TolC family protein [Rubinisphaera margarita]|uniref:TolC family protein n=1 Tax=Rubinisphaera margarita TaxID=2909586 RepID=UPI001EE83506|nr:TolC family protein [Rubinisphaera margarita]MCG6156332.1 TolC family protein [Rubinisphaera margarita]